MRLGAVGRRSGHKGCQFWFPRLQFETLKIIDGPCFNFAIDKGV